MTSYIWNGKIKGVFGAFIILIKSSWMQMRDLFNTWIVKNNIGESGKNVRIHSGVKYRYPKNINIGNEVIISRGVTFISENSNSKLIINDNVIITVNSYLDFSGGIKIGKNTLISKNTIIETHDHGLDPHSTPIFKDLDIGENVWIGMHSIILPDVRKIGSNSIIAAGSVVTKKVPENCIIAGVPAKIIKKR